MHTTSITTLALFLACVLAWSAPLLGAREGSPGRLPRCLVCEHEVPDLERVRVHRGREVLLCSDECVVAWEADPEAYFARLQPSGALFQEGGRPRGPISRPWFLLGVYMSLGLVFGAICAYSAIHRGLAPKPWFFAGLAANVLALAVLATRRRAGEELGPAGVPGGLRKVPTTRPPAACPACGHENHPSATACAACKSALTPAVRSEVDAVQGPRKGSA